MGEKSEIISNTYLSLFKAATKTIKDERWKLQTWRHKAVRRAYGDFMIPKNRKIEAFEIIENLNDSILAQTDHSSYEFLTLDNENALRQLGVALTKANGVAIASNYHGKEKYLEDFGFCKNGGSWSINYLEDATVYSPTEQTPVEAKPQLEKPQPKLQSPAARLFAYLVSKNLQSDEIKIFVSDVLGLTKDDKDEINELMSDLDNLNSLISDFIAESKTK